MTSSPAARRRPTGSDKRDCRARRGVRSRPWLPAGQRARRGGRADLRYGRTLPRALRAAGLADVAAAGSFPVGGLACGRLGASTIRHVRGELLAAGLADDAEIDTHLAAIHAGELDLTLAPLISAWGRRPAEHAPTAG